MKTKLFIIVGSLIIFSCQLAFANGYYRYSYKGERPVVAQRIYQPMYACNSCNTGVYSKYECEGSACEEENACQSCSSYRVNCECSDPACSSCNSCLDRNTCCAAFGNIGRGDFDQLCVCNS